jgi:HlyD family secretion protein
MKRLFLIALVVVIIAASWLILSQEREPTLAALPAGVVTALVERASIESLISATGSVAAEHEQQISFATAGQVNQVLVRQGERVEAGQVLATLDDRDLRLSLMQAEAAVAISEAQLAQAKLGSTAEEIARYEAAVSIARASGQSAQAAVDSAQANLSRLLAGASAEEITIAERRIEEAKNRLWGAQSQRDAICGRVQFGGGQAECDNAGATVNQAQEGVTIAELQLQTTLKGARVEDLTGARAQLDQAKAQVAQSQAQLVQAEADLARARRGPSPEQVAVVEAQVAQARVGVEVARARLEDVVLKAPATGMLARWGLYVGDRVSPGTPVGALVDDARYHLTVSIDETDIRQVQPGQLARLQLDAYPAEQQLGRVAEIEMLGANTQGIVTYNVRIDLEPSELVLRPMMTATVDIVAEEKADVVRVPNRAIRRDARGRYVQVVQNNQLVRVDVRVGVSDAEYTEVLEGLQEGDAVVISLPREDMFGGAMFGAN